MFKKVWWEVGRCRRGGTHLSLKGGFRPSDNFKLQTALYVVGVEDFVSLVASGLSEVLVVEFLNG